MDTEISNAAAELGQLRKLDQRAYFRFITGISSQLAAAQRRELFPSGTDDTDPAKIGEPFPHGTDAATMAAKLGLSREDVATMTRGREQQKTLDEGLAALTPDERKCIASMVGSNPDDVAAFLAQRRGA